MPSSIQPQLGFLLPASCSLSYAFFPVEVGVFGILHLGISHTGIQRTVQSSFSSSGQPGSQVQKFTSSKFVAHGNPSLLPLKHWNVRSFGQEFVDRLRVGLRFFQHWQVSGIL